MPRDLESIKQTMESMAPLTKTSHSAQDSSAADNDPGDKLQRDMQKEDQRNQLHPFAQTLNITHLDSICNLENATFPPHEAASREKVGSILASTIALVFPPPCTMRSSSPSVVPFCISTSSILYLFLDVTPGSPEVIHT